jgi:hypothetical protein
LVTESTSYTNRKGKTYYLHSVKNRKGALRYVMKASPAGALNALPDGHEIVEGVNGEVSVRRKKPQLIKPLEVQLVKSGLEKRGLQGYRAAAKDKRITVYEPLKKEEDYQELLGLQAAYSQQFVESIAAHLPDDSPEMASMHQLLGQVDDAPREATIQRLVPDSPVEPVLRFTLSNKEKRLFDVERMTYSGEGGWHYPAFGMRLADAAREYLPHLGKESFFEQI